MATPGKVQFDDETLNQAHTHKSEAGKAPETSPDEGIFFSRSAPQIPRRSLSRFSHHNTSRHVDDDDPEYTGLRRPGDYKAKQVFRGRQLLLLAYQSIGVIYGDIGTSPLYVYSSTFTSGPPKRDDLIGVLSLIVWSLFMMVTVKYIFIILRADNLGEGGTFSCYSLLSRYANITHRDPREEPLIKIERFCTEELPNSSVHVRNTLEKSKFIKALLKVIGVLAVSMVMSDGVLTPAQSVLGAVQGLEVAVPNISKSTVIGAACGILVALFLVQPFGTTKIGITFAPVVILWLGYLAASGIYNLVIFDSGVFIALNPAEAFGYLMRNGTEGWKSLGGVLLAFTGVEALFADLGAFTMRAIQISWLCYTFPCLLLAYIGQAAYIAVKPEAYAYPVFHTAPPGCLVFSLVLAVLATIVASQAIITATFQLIAQIIKLSYFPQIKVVHTSKIYHNQLYVPSVNYLLCIGTIIIAAVFNNTTSLGQAYGVCVMFVTFFDTTMVTLVALIVWKIRPWIVLFPWLMIACMDGIFLSSALIKVPNGAWFTLTLATTLASIFILWRFGKEQQWKAEAADRLPIQSFVTKNAGDGSLMLAGHTGGEILSINRGLGIFFDKGGIKTPLVFSQFIAKLVSIPEVIIFFHMRPLEYPTVPPDERFVVSKMLSLPNCYRVILRHGYMDEVVTPDLASLIYQHLRDYVTKEQAPISPSEKSAVVVDSDHSADEQKAPETTVTGSEDGQRAALVLIQKAFEHRVLYIVGKEEMKIAPDTRLMRALTLNIFLFIRSITRAKLANLKLPTDRLVEIGFIKTV